MVIEMNVNQKELESGLEELNLYLKQNINKTIIIELFKKYTSSKSGYYELRDSAIPAIIGDNASKSLFWCIWGCFLTESNIELIRKYLDNENINFINSLVVLYLDKMLEAKNYNENPMGYQKLHISYSAGNIRNNLFIKRNDGEEYVFNVEIKDVLKMTKDMLHYYNMIQDINKYNLTEECLNDIKEIKHIIESIEKLGCDNNE